jgi:CheY-like chemotaxis protein
MTLVLVVEDEPLIAMALESVLVDAGYQVTIAANGRQALDRLAEAQADIVLLDMMMPVMNGPALLVAMAADPVLAGIPVIVLTSLPEAAVRAPRDRIANIMQKPYTARDILAAVARVLGNPVEL